MKKTIIFIFVISIGNCLQASQPVIDSLQALLAVETEPKEQLYIRNKIAFNYYRIDPAKTVQMSLDNIEMAKQIGDEEGRLSAINNMAIGQVFEDQSQLALETFELLEEEGKKAGFMTIVHRASNNKGNLFADLGQVEKATAAFHKAVSIAKMENDDAAYCLYLNNLVGVLIGQGEYEKAKRYFENALPVARSLPSQSTLGEMTLGYGQLMEKMGKPNEAMEFYLEALNLAKHSKSSQSMISVLNSMAGLEHDKKKFSKALKYNKEALSLAKEFKSYRVLTEPYFEIAKTYEALERFEESIEFAEKGIEAARESNNIAIKAGFYEILANAHEGLDLYEEALGFQKVFKMVQDSLAELNQAQKIKEVSLKYDMEAKEEENVKLRAEQSQQLVAIKLQNQITLLGGLGLLLVSIIALMLYRNNQRKYKYNQQLEQEVKLSTKDLEESNIQLQRTNKELERFAHIASHDLKEPLRNITSFVRLIERRLSGENEHLKEYLQFVQNNAKQMHILIEDVLEFSKLNEAQPVFENVDVGQTLKQVEMGMEKFLKDKNANLDFDDMPMMTSSGSQLYLLFKNLVENGVIFNDSKKPRVTISYEQVDSDFIFRIADNGIGIEKKYQSKIFGMFHRLHGRVKHHGSGLGLSVCKKIATRLNGDIWVESSDDSGSSFFVKLPIEPAKNKGNLTVKYQKKTADNARTTVVESV